MQAGTPSTRPGTAGSTIAVLPAVPTMQDTPHGPPAGFPADSVPTDVVKGPDGAWYVSQLVGFPFEKGSSTIWRIVPGHAPTAYATGFTNVTSLAFDPRGHLYAVEIAADGLLSGPIGALVRVRAGATSPEVVTGGLFAPYGLAMPRAPRLRHDPQHGGQCGIGREDRPLSRRPAWSGGRSSASRTAATRPVLHRPSWPLGPGRGRVGQWAAFVSVSTIGSLTTLASSASPPGLAPPRPARTSSSICLPVSASTLFQ